MSGYNLDTAPFFLSGILGIEIPCEGKVNPIPFTKNIGAFSEHSQDVALDNRIVPAIGHSHQSDLGQQGKLLSACGILDFKQHGVSMGEAADQLPLRWAAYYIEIHRSGHNAPPPFRYFFILPSPPFFSKNYFFNKGLV